MKKLSQEIVNDAVLKLKKGKKSNGLLKLQNWQEVEKYINQAKNKSDLERQENQKDKTGIELESIKAINPANKERLHIFVADYVMVNYGTGAIMAVPAHDQRDLE